MDPTPAPDIVFVTVDDRPIATRHRPATRAGAATLVFLPGYASDMEGAKAEALDAWCAAQGHGCLRLDYSGTGSSPGDFADGTLARWIADARGAIDARLPADAPLVLAGSSMGGWIMLHLALALSSRVRGLLGIAAAPDFTDWGFSDAQKAVIAAEGKLEEPNPYGPEPFVTHRGFFDSGQSLRLLDSTIAFDGPVRMVHGTDDADVPVATAQRLMAALRSSDVQLRLLKQGGHRLSEPHEIAAILAEAAALMESAC